MIQLLEHMARIDASVCDALLLDPEATEALVAMAAQPAYIERAASINLGAVPARAQEEYRCVWVWVCVGGGNRCTGPVL